MNALAMAVVLSGALAAQNGALPPPSAEEDLATQYDRADEVQAASITAITVTVVAGILGPMVAVPAGFFLCCVGLMAQAVLMVPVGLVAGALGAWVAELVRGRPPDFSRMASAGVGAGAVALVGSVGVALSVGLVIGGMLVLEWLSTQTATGVFGVTFYLGPLLCMLVGFTGFGLVAVGMGAGAFAGYLLGRWFPVDVPE